MVASRDWINVAEYANEAFTDSIYVLVKAEAIRLHQSEGLELVAAGMVAAYLAMLPILAIANGGIQGRGAELHKLVDKLFNDISKLGDEHE
jgi:hypothetical protein